MSFVDPLTISLVLSQIVERLIVDSGPEQTDGPMRGHIAVDASTSIHQKLSRNAEAIVDKNDWTGFQKDMESAFKAYSRMAKNAAAVFVFVFDGRRISAKRANEDRRKDRQAAEADVERLTTSIHELQQLAQATPDDDGIREQLNLEMQNLVKAKSKVASGKNEEATQVAIAVCQKLKLKYVLAPGEAEHQMRSMQAAGHVLAVFGYDSDFFAMGCDRIIYGSSPYGTLRYLTWNHCATLIQPNTPLLPFISRANKPYHDLDKAVSNAIERFGAQIVVQLSALFISNDYGSCKVGFVKLGKAWKVLLHSGSEPTISALAAAVPSTHAEMINEIVRTAERAAIMYHCQGAILQGHGGTCRLTCGELPAFAEKCTAQLFLPQQSMEPATQDEMVKRLRRYVAA